MSSNTSAGGSGGGFELLPCDNITATSEELAVLKAVVIPLAVTAVLINILHMYVLTNLQTLRGSSYRIILYHIAIADIVPCTMYLLRFPLFDGYTKYKQMKASHIAAIAIITDWCEVTPYYALLTACVDRYLAMCQPMRYQTSIFVTHIWKWIASLWIIPTIVSATTYLTLADTVCYRVFYDLSIGSGVSGTVHTVLIMVPVTACYVLLGFVLKELCKMKSRSQPATSGRHDADVLRATKYTIVIAVTLLLGVLAHMVQHMFTSQLGIDKTFEEGSYIIAAIYAIINTVEFGLINKSYRKAAADLLLCRKTRRISAEVADAGTSQRAQ